MALKFKISAGALSAVISFLERACEKKTTIPILGCVFLNVNQAGQLLACATDLFVSIKTIISGAEIESPGQICLPVEKLLPIVRSLTGDVVVEALAGWKTKISWEGGNKLKLSGYDPAQYPPLPSVPDSLQELPGLGLRTLVWRTEFSASRREENRFSLSGALFKITPTEMVMVSSDGARMSVATEQAQSGVSLESFLTLRALPIIEALEGETVLYGQDDSWMYFVDSQTCLAVKRVTFSFPAWNALLAAAGANPIKAKLSSFGLAAACRRLAVIADENSRAAMLTFASSGLLVKGAGFSGEADEKIEAEVTGGEVKMAFSVDLLAEFLGKVSGEILFSVKDEKTPAIFEIPGWKHIVVPMHIPGAKAAQAQAEVAPEPVPAEQNKPVEDW